MAAPTSADVDTAIKSVLTGGQEYRLVDGTEVKRANLEKLMDLKVQLTQQEAAAQNQTGIFVPVQYGRPA